MPLGVVTVLYRRPRRDASRASPRWRIRRLRPPPPTLDTPEAIRTRLNDLIARSACTPWRRTTLPAAARAPPPAPATPARSPRTPRRRVVRTRPYRARTATAPSARGSKTICRSAPRFASRSHSAWPSTPPSWTCISAAWAPAWAWRGPRGTSRCARWRRTTWRASPLRRLCPTLSARPFPRPSRFPRPAAAPP